MKQGWEIKKLGEVCEFSQGIQVPIEEQYNKCEEGMIRFLRIIDFTQDGEIPRYVYNVGERYILHDNETAIVRYGTPGFVCYGKYGIIANNLFKILPKQNIFHTPFLRYWLKSNAFQGVIRGAKYGVALQAIKFSTISSIPIPVPPREEQERIVAELDCLSGVIEKKREQLKELDALAQSIFYQMFGDPITNEKGWEVKKLGEVCEDKKKILRASKKCALEDVINYIDISAIDNINNVINIPTPYIFEDAPSRAQQIVQLGDVIVSMVRPNLKNIAIVNCNYDNLIASSGFCVLRVRKEMTIPFLFYIVKSDAFTMYLMDRVSGANYPAVRESDITDYISIIPPIALQQEFADKIEAIEKQKELIKKSISETETLFNARMDYYFN